MTGVEPLQWRRVQRKIRRIPVVVLAMDNDRGTRQCGLRSWRELISG